MPIDLKLWCVYCGDAIEGEWKEVSPHITAHPNCHATSTTRRAASAEKLRERYETDALFHAAVEVYSRIVGHGGFTDDDGVHHDGPTLADARMTERLEDAWRSIGFPEGGSSSEPESRG